MANFNTNQARHFYVALDLKSTAAGVTTVGDLAMLTNESGDLYFVYKNGDGLVTRSDLIPAGNIEYCNVAENADLATPLMAHTIVITESNPATAFAGKTLNLTITVRQLIDYDDASAITIPVAVPITASMSTKAAFHKALAMAIAKAAPKRAYPFFKVFSNGSEVTRDTAEGSVTGAAGGVVLVQAAQKYRRGLMSNEPVDFTVSFDIAGTNDVVDAWGTDTVAPSAIDSNTVIPASYKLADLEYFSYGERGDYYRGSMWPNNYEPTYMINPASCSYDVLTIQYFWQGHAENIQKSPRTIQIAGASADIAELKALVDAAMGKEGSASA